jgi:fibronectin-binding autotransporter adhesin
MPTGIPGTADIVAVNNGTTAQVGVPIGAPNAEAESLFIGDSLTGSPAVAKSTLQLLPGGNLFGLASVTIGPQGTLAYSGGFTNVLATYSNNGIILIDGSYSSDSQLPGTITGSGGLTYADPNSFVLVGPNNTYSGETLITAGILRAGSATALSPNSAFVVNSTLDLNSFSSTIGSLSGTGTVLNNVAGTATLTVGQDNTNTTFSGVLQVGTGVLALTKIGTGTLTLTNTNTYSGGTNLNGGILAVNSDVNLGTGPLSFNGGTLEALAGLVSGKAITLNVGGGTFLADVGTTSTLSGVITGAGSWTKSGAGSLTLIGTNTYTGGTTINAGTLQLGNGGTAGTIAGSVIDNGILAFDHSTALTFAGNISGVGGVTQIGSGTTILSGNNTYSGATLVSAGTLEAGSANGFSQNSEFTVNSFLDIHGFNNTIGSLSGSGFVLNSGPTIAGLTVGKDNANSIFNGVLEDGTSELQLIKIGTGTLSLTAANTYTGGTTISAGTLQIGTGGSIVGIVINNGILSFETSSGGGTAITNNGGTAIIPVGGLAQFFGASTAGNATITNNAGTVGGTAGGETDFGNTSTAGNAAITNNGGFNGAAEGLTKFLSTSTAGHATISNNGGDGTTSGGFADFLNSSTAGSAIISNHGGATVGGRGGITGFGDTSTAGNAAITNNGGTVFNAFGGLTQFFDTSTAGNATITNNGGSFGGEGGTTLFLASSDGGSARVITNGNGRFDISGLTAAGMGVGSIEGSGNYFLGSKMLTVGGNNLSTAVSGVIQDGGIDGGTGGSLLKVGTGTLTLTGTNTYTGGTTIHAGTIQLGNGGTTGSIAGNVTDNGTLAFNRSDSVTFAGVISGTGQVVKLGTGSLTLTSANTYTGTTKVDSGSLIVDGSTMSAQTLVNSGAFLGGNGTIRGNVVNSGTVSQINSPGTLTVTGDYTQNPGGTLRIGVAGVATGQHDLLAVGGHATLGGTLQLISLGGFSLQPGNHITFLTANNGVSGAFSNTQNGLVSTGTIVQAQVTTTSNSAVLVATQGSFTNTPGVATNSNNLAVAKTLDSARGDPREAALFAFLNSQPLANLPNDLTLIAPTQISSINATAVSVAKVQIANVAMRLAAVHAGSTGFSSAGLSINSGTVSYEGLAGPSGSEGKSGPAVFAPTPDNRWGVFLTGLGEFTNVYSTPQASGYNVDTGGFTFGVDYRLTPNFAIGLTGGYAHTSVNLDAGGNIDVNGGKLGAYATIFGNNFYLDTAVTGGPSGYQTRRTALQGTASGNTDGADFNAMVAAGYNWNTGNLSIGPTASFQYSYVGLNSFTETGSLAPLNFPNQNTQSELSAFGAKATYSWKIGQVTVLPQISAAWQHEYGATAYSVIASFASGAGNSFTVTGRKSAGSILVGAGATVILNDRISTYLYYDGEFARTNYLSNNVSGGVRVSF